MASLIAVLDVGLVQYCIYSGLKARPPFTCNKWKLLIANYALCSPRIPRHASRTHSGRARAPLTIDPHHTARYLRVWSRSRGIMYVRTGFSPRVEGGCHTSGEEGVWCTRRMGEELWCVALHRTVRAWIIMPGMMTTVVMCLGPVTIFFASSSDVWLKSLLCGSIQRPGLEVSTIPQLWVIIYLGSPLVMKRTSQEGFLIEERA